MAVGAAGVAEQGDVFPIAAFAVLANEHFAFFTVNFQQEFVADGAAFAGHVIMGIILFAGDDLPH